MFEHALTGVRARRCHLLRIGSLALVSLSSCATSAGIASRDTTASRDTIDTPSARRSAPASPSPNAAGSFPGPVLERSAYVREVLRSNPTIESARQGWRAAQARVRQAGVLDDPMLEIGVAPLSIAASDAPFGYEVTLRQRLPWFGKRSLEGAVAGAEAEASRSDYEGLQRELALAALSLYVEYFVVVRSSEINAAHVDLMRAMRDAALAQLGSGPGSAQDALQAEAELAHMEHDAVVLEAERDVKVAQMNELLHREPHLPLPPPPLQLGPPPVLDVSQPRLEAEALEKRPDIASARQRVRGEAARADRAEREYLPDLTLSASYNSMWDMPEHRWMVGLEVNLPVQVDKRAGAAEEARAMRAQFESDLARLTDAARTQVFVLSRQLAESTHILELFERRLLPVARDQIDAARAGFSTSQGSFLAVLEAERNLRKVELEFQTAQAERDRRRGELERALGRIPGLDGADR